MLEIFLNLYRKYQRLSIRTKIFLVFLVIMLAFLFRLTFSTRYYMVERQGQDMVANGLNVAHRYFTNYIEQFDFNFYVLAHETKDKGLNEETFRHLLAESKKWNQAYRPDMFFYIGTDNTVLCGCNDSYKEPSGDSMSRYLRTMQSVKKAFNGVRVNGVEVLPGDVVRGEGLARKAEVAIIPTASSQPRAEKREQRALAVVSAQPIVVNGRITGVLAAARILNNRFDIVDMISRDTNYKATIFLDDLRVSTNVPDEEGSRAMGTLMSKAVRDVVLAKGQPYYGRAYVVNDWYITAYEPIRDIGNRVVGSLYVGIEESPLVKTQHDLNRDITLALLVLTLIFMLALYWLYRSIVLPVHRMSTWALRCAKGELDCRIPSRIPNMCWELRECEYPDCPVYGKTNVRCWLVPQTPCTNFSEDTTARNICLSCKVYKMSAGNEIDQLADAFNFMAASLEDYTASLYNLNLQLEDKNVELIDQRDELECQKEQLMALNSELEESMRALDDSQSIIYALAVAVEAKDPYTRGHSERVADYSIKLASAVGLPSHQADVIRGAALLHDIGKIGISGTILRKPVTLTAIEFQQVKKHPTIGERICSSLKFAKDMLPIIRHHHEHYNGKGYPDGLKGVKIPLMARIVAIADAFDAMTSDRPYRPGMTPEEALGILGNGAGIQWDPDLVPIFAKIIRQENGGFQEQSQTETEGPLQ